MFKVGDTIKLKKDTGEYTTKDLIKVTKVHDDGYLGIKVIRTGSEYRRNDPNGFEYYKNTNMNLK